jgi:ankyrin repeat protein
MTRRGTLLASILAVVAGAAILLLVWFLLLPYLYVQSENRNFEELRRKSALDCATMPLHCAVRDEDLAAVTGYLAAGGDAELKDNWGRSALFWAVYNGRDAMAEALLAAGAEPNTRDEAGMTLFYHTLAGGNFDLADALLAAGADIDAMNGVQDLETILHRCVMQNREDCVQFLLARGADRHLADSYGYTPLQRVELHDHIDAAIGELLRE